MKASDIYDRVTAQVIRQLETASASDWSVPWFTMATGTPRNASTGKAYRGGNAWSFLVSDAGSTPYWGTFRQWLALGLCVRKGETAEHGIYWKRSDKRKVGGKLVPLAPGEHGGLVPFGFAVFNYSQVAPLEGFDGVTWEPPIVVERPANERHAAADAMFAATGSRVLHAPGRAFYAPAADYVSVPDLADFRDAESYYSTLAHEHGHWTGHPSRLARDLTGRFGSDAYAMEELVAEMSAAFMCAAVGVSATPRADHASYLASWLGVLRGDSKAIYAAAKAAQDAADLVIGTTGAETAGETDETADLAHAAA